MNEKEQLLRTAYLMGCAGTRSSEFEIWLEEVARNE